MKKIIALTLALILSFSAVILASCGNDSSNASNSSGSDSASTGVKTLTLDDFSGNVINIEYPETFKFDEENTTGEFLGQKVSTKCGTLVGTDYEIGFAFGSLYENAYSDFESYVAQFKNGNIYEETELDGHTTYIRQDGDYYIQVIVVVGDTDYFCIEVRQDDGNAASYKKIYDSKEFKNILKSVKFGEASEAEPLTTEKGYLTVTPTTGWHKGEDTVNESITLYNDKISSVTYACFIDSQLTSVEKQMEYILVGYEGKEFKEEKIGDNTYQVLDMDDLVYLVAETSTGKSIEIEVRNCTLDDARELLETVEIH